MKFQYRRSGKDVSKDEIVKMVELFKQGLTLRSIGEKINRRDSTISRYLTKLGLKRRRSGRIKNGMGYILIRKPDHHRANKGGYVLEHILVWEESHGCPLPDGFSIHHLNGIKGDNRPENLLAMKTGEHIHQAEPYKKRIMELEMMLSEKQKIYPDFDYAG